MTADAAAGRQVLGDQVEEKRGLAGAGLADDVQMAPARGIVEGERLAAVEAEHNRNMWVGIHGSTRTPGSSRQLPDGFALRSLVRSPRSSLLGCAVAGATRSTGARLSHKGSNLECTPELGIRTSDGCGYSRSRWDPIGLDQNFVSRGDRRFSGTGKSPIDKMLSRKLASFARRLSPILAPPRRAGRLPVVALSWWLQRIPPDFVSGPSTCPLAPLRRPDCSSTK